MSSVSKPPSVQEQVVYQGRLDLCGATGEELDEFKPVAELIYIQHKGRGKREEFASLLGYEPPEGVVVLSRRPLFLHTK